MDILYLKKKTTILPQNMNQGTNVQFSVGARQFSHFTNIKINSPVPPPTQNLPFNGYYIGRFRSFVYNFFGITKYKVTTLLIFLKVYTYVLYPV
jgi:hypothetical protein